MSNTEIILILVGFVLTYGAAFLAAWININLKIKELEMKLIALENMHNKDINDLRILIERFMTGIETINTQNTNEHEKIIAKVDTIKENINDIKITIARNGRTMEKINNHNEENKTY